MRGLPVREEIRLADGEFPRWAWPGGYTLIYLTARDEVLCGPCASRDRSEDFPGPAVVYGTYDEGPSIPCEDCGQYIESSYGDPDEEEEEATDA